MSNSTLIAQNVELLSRGEYRDAFTNPNVELFIPVDETGKTVPYTQAVHFQCWSVGERNPNIPALVTLSDQLENCWLKKDFDYKFVPLARCAAYGSIKIMDEWLFKLNRNEAGDIKDIGNITLY